MDLRGAGDILGEQQVGHIRLVGVELYRHLLERAIAEVGGPVEREWAPELNLGVTGLIPPDYVADPEIRINLYARASRIRFLPDIDQFAEEVEDRFGQMPPATQNLLQLARIRETARRLRVVRLDAGPRAIALTFQPSQVEHMRIQGGSALPSPMTLRMRDYGASRFGAATECEVLQASKPQSTMGSSHGSDTAASNDPVDLPLCLDDAAALFTTPQGQHQ